MSTATKRSLRRSLRAWRSSLPAEVRQAGFRGAIDQLLTTGIFDQADTVALYVALPSEPDLSPVWDRALQSGKTIALPVVIGSGLPLEWRSWQPGQPLRRSSFGVPEPGPKAAIIDPSAIDLAIVPALAVSLAGYRLGYGGGYYDRTLPLLTRATSVWLGLPDQILGEVPVEPFDVPVHALVTTRGAMPARGSPPEIKGLLEPI